MTQSIKLNNKVSIDLQKLISGKLLLQAGSGGGKSYATRRLLEQSFGMIPQIVLDTEGEYASLRDKYDYILIGKGYDIAADPKTAALMALRLWERRVSAIIDLYELDPEDRQKFVDAFVGAMINAPKNLWKPVLLVIDEAHEYAPENEKSQYGLSMLRLASKGRKRQIAAVFATQSIASLSKRIVASCKNKLIGYASETNDVKRAAFELSMTPQEGLTLRDLDPGEFYAFGPAISKKIIKFKIGPVKTIHEGVSGQVLKVAPPSAKIKKELAALADLPAEAAEEANTLAAFRQENNDLKRQLRERPKQDPDAVKKVADKAFDLGVESMKTQMRARDKEWEKTVAGANKEIGRLGSVLNEINKLTHKYLSTAVISGPEKIKIVLPPPKEIIEKFTASIPVQEVKRWVGSEGTNDDVTLDKGQQACLIAIGQHGDEGLPRASVTTITGYKKSTRNEYLRRLANKGLIREKSNRFYITEEGRVTLGENFEVLPTGVELYMHLMKTLPEGEKRVLAAVKEGNATREAISGATGYEKSTRNEYIRRLSHRELIDVGDDRITLVSKLTEAF